MTRLKMAIAAILFFIGAYFVDLQPSQSQFKDWPAVLVQTYSGTSSGKYSHLEFIAVYRLENGRVFDRNISASFYSQAVIGDTYIIHARPMDIFPEERTADKFFSGLGYLLVKAILWVAFVVFSVLAFVPKSIIDSRNK